MFLFFIVVRYDILWIITTGCRGRKSKLFLVKESMYSTVSW